jgi:hypothetical protein
MTYAFFKYSVLTSRFQAIDRTQGHSFVNYSRIEELMDFQMLRSELLELITHGKGRVEPRTAKISRGEEKALAGKAK